MHVPARISPHAPAGRSLLFVLTWLLLGSSAQAAAPRRSVLVSIAAGPALVHTSVASPDGARPSLSFPNLKFGYFLSERLAVALYLPGTIYQYRGEDRPRARGLEGAMPALQYWVTEHFWVLGGLGLGLDAPVFYDVRGSHESAYHAGLGGAVGAGYEFARSRRLTFSAELRAHGGVVRVPEGPQRGASVESLIGIAWY